jgi:hypothetical protein
VFTEAEVLENTMSDLEKHHIGFGQEKRRNPLIRIVISGLRMLPKFWFSCRHGFHWAEENSRRISTGWLLRS